MVKSIKHEPKVGALLTGPEYEDDEHIVSGIADEVHAHAGEDITSGTVADARIASTIARDSEVTSAISTHAGAADPHGDRAFATAADVVVSTAFASADTTHAAASDPHPGYLTPGEGNAAYDAAGAAAAAQAASQPLDSDLTAVAGLSPSNDDVLQRKAGAWINRTLAQLKSDLAVGGVASDAIFDAAGDLVQGTGADTAAKLSLGTAAYGLVSTGSAAAWAEILPWHVQLIPMVATPDATTGTWGLANSNDSAQNFGFYVPGSTANSGGAAGWSNAGAAAVNDACAWDVILAKGTWDAHFWVRKSTNTAIVTLNQDGSSQGTVDTYNAAVGVAAKVSITGWTVATTGKHRMQIVAATKNASSSGFTLQLYAIEFRRTA